MSAVQLDIFEVDNIKRMKEIKSEIHSRLRHYGVDEYYERYIKGNNMLLREIRERLSNLPKYDEYLKLLIKELSGVVPTVSRDEKQRFSYSHLIKMSDHYRYYCRYINRGSRIGCEGAVFCLKMIEDDFFIN